MVSEHTEQFPRRYSEYFVCLSNKLCLSFRQEGTKLELLIIFLSKNLMRTTLMYELLNDSSFKLLSSEFVQNLFKFKNNFTEKESS